MKKLFVLVCLAGLASCSTETGGSATVGSGAPIGHLVRWRCDGGASFGVSFTTTGARVAAGGENYALPHVQGSGARYSNGSVQYWERGGSATLTGARGGPYTNCRHG
jgi:membrane-bound inhibitor of C-type lysozyme